MQVGIILFSKQMRLSPICGQDASKALWCSLRDASRGYVPNVISSCGALLQGRRLILPYGIAYTSRRLPRFR